MIQLQTKKAVVYWQLNDPSVANAIGPSMVQMLMDRLAELKRDLVKAAHSPKVLVISSKVTKGIWVAGGNLSELAKLERADVVRYCSRMSRFCLALTKLPIPVIMAVDGLAIGGGVELALAGDYIVVSSEARFQFKQLDVGLSLGYGSTQRLVESIGLAKARSWILGRQTLSAQEAYASGLVAQVLPQSGFFERVEQLAIDFAALDSTAVENQKKMLYLSHHRHAKEHLAKERVGFLRSWGNPKHQEFMAQWSLKNL